MNINLSPSAETVQTVVHQYFAASRLDNDRKVEAMVDCFTENCLHYEPVEGSPFKGQAELRQFLTKIATLFSTVGLTEDFISINYSLPFVSKLNG